MSRFRPVDADDDVVDGLRPEPPLTAADVIDELRARIQWRQVAVGIAVLLAAGLVTWWLLRPGPEPPELSLPMARPAPSVTPPPPTSAPDLAVHVTGQVATPGVYRLTPPALVQDALAAAGGPTATADLQRLNLAAPLADGMQIWVPGVDDEPPSVVGPTGPAIGSDPGAGVDGAAQPTVDLNAATAADLESLPGVGPATAAAILAHRDQHGPFSSVDELIEVRGIGPAKLEAIRPLVTV
jgi:competence protein ComEA